MVAKYTIYIMYLCMCVCVFVLAPIVSRLRVYGVVYLVICCFSTKNATHIVYLIVNKRACSLQVTNYYYQVPEPRTALSPLAFILQIMQSKEEAQQEKEKRRRRASRIYTKSRCQQVSTMFAQALELPSPDHVCPRLDWDT